jgi:hypothetical protein
VSGFRIRWNGEPGVGLRAFDPLSSDHPLVGDVCPACGERFKAGDRTTLIPVGPGEDEESQRKHAQGRWYSAVAVPVHAACAGVAEKAE